MTGFDQLFNDLLEVSQSQMCSCECHTPGVNIIHCVPCCNRTYEKDTSRHEYQSTIDFVGRLMGNK